MQSVHRSMPKALMELQPKQKTGIYSGVFRCLNPAFLVSGEPNWLINITPPSFILSQQVPREVALPERAPLTQSDCVSF